MTMIQLTPPIPVFVVKRTPNEVEPNGWREGEGYAYLVIDYSQEHGKLYTVGFDTYGGELWDVPQTHVRIQNNTSLQRKPK